MGKQEEVKRAAFTAYFVLKSHRLMSWLGRPFSATWLLTHP